MNQFISLFFTKPVHKTFAFNTKVFTNEREPTQDLVYSALSLIDGFLHLQFSITHIFSMPLFLFLSFRLEFLYLVIAFRDFSLKSFVLLLQFADLVIAKKRIKPFEGDIGSLGGSVL